MPRLRCYDPSGDGGGGIHGWYDGLSPVFRAQVDTVLELLALEDDLDAVPEVKAMRGACVGLTEIEINFYAAQQKVSLRILGFVGPDRGDFTLLTGFERSKDTAATYGFHCPQAQQRKEGVMGDGKRAPPCRFP
jgi:hypothetical protein